MPLADFAEPVIGPATSGRTRWLHPGYNCYNRPMTPDPRIADLIEAGEIRLGLFLPQYAKDAAGGECRGIGIGFVAIAMMRALAERLDVAMRVVEFPTPPTTVGGLKTGACDLAFMGIEPSRTAVLDFTAPVVQFDYTFIVPVGSPLQHAAACDRPGLRIAVVRGHASTLELTRIAKHAELIGFDLPDDAFDLLRSGKADAFAAPREVLLDYAAKLPDSRVLADAYGVNNVGIAVAKGHAGRLAFISAFAEDAKASGLVGEIIARGGLRGFRVAPRSA